MTISVTGIARTHGRCMCNLPIRPGDLVASSGRRHRTRWIHVECRDLPGLDDRLDALTLIAQRSPGEPAWGAEIADLKVARARILAAAASRFGDRVVPTPIAILPRAW